MHRTLIALSLPLACTGCAFDSSVAGTVADEIFRSKILDLFASAILWGVLGAGLGALLGLGGFFAIRAAGGYAWGWRHAKWFRVLTALVVVGGVGVTGCLVGLWEGGLRGAEVVLRQSRIATDVFPVVSDLASTFTCELYLSGQDDAAGRDSTTFHEGAWEIDAEDLVLSTSRLKAEAIETPASKLRDRVLAEHPEWRDSNTSSLITWVLDQVGHSVIDKKSKSIDDVFREVVESFPESAAASGDPKSLSHKELSEHFTQRALVPLTLRPLRSFVRGQQLVSLLIALGCFLVPPLGFRLAEWLRTRNTTPPTPEGDAPTPEADPA